MEVRLAGAVVENHDRIGQVLPLGGYEVPARPGELTTTSELNN